jgi:hypothetical protein
LQWLLFSDRLAVSFSVCVPFGLAVSFSVCLSFRVPQRQPQRLAVCVSLRD